MKFNGMSLAFKYCQGFGAEFCPSSQNPFYPEKFLKITPSNGIEYIYESDLIDRNFYLIEQDKISNSIGKIDIIGDSFFKNYPHSFKPIVLYVSFEFYAFLVEENFHNN